MGRAVCAVPMGRAVSSANRSARHCTPESAGLRLRAAPARSSRFSSRASHCEDRPIGYSCSPAEGRSFSSSCRVRPGRFSSADELRHSGGESRRPASPRRPGAGCVGVRLGAYAGPGGTFGNRPQGEYRVLYASSERLGALIETLSRFRPDPVLVRALGEIEDEDGPIRLETGTVPGEWIANRVIPSPPTSGTRRLRADGSGLRPREWRRSSGSSRSPGLWCRFPSRPRTG
jgi:hypothetical protein